MKPTNNLPPISEWTRIFVDTSFIIDSVRKIDAIRDDDPKRISIEKSHRLLDHFQLSGQEVIWITSSIVLSELLKFENKDAVDELQKIFNTANIEIINFTRKEASFLVNDMVNFLEQKHVGRYVRELQTVLANDDIFNPKNYITNDALIIACAKSKRCDVLLTSDEKSFMKIAKQLGLPVLLSKDIPTDLYDHIDYKIPIATDY